MGPLNNIVRVARASDPRREAERHRTGETPAPPLLRRWAVFIASAFALLGSLAVVVAQPAPVVVRIATFNVQDVRTQDLETADHPRLRRVAEVIQRLRPNILLLNEIAYDLPGAPGVELGEAAGRNGQRFADLYLAVSQAEGLAPLKYRSFMAPVNTGMASGFDLNNDGRAVSTYSPSPPPNADGTWPSPSSEARAYGEDCWGFGAFPGQYGMALLVDDRLEILLDRVRTFRLFPWTYMPAALLPPGADGAGDWFSEEEKALVRLSSKSHWDVPVKLPGGAFVRLLCSHPTPPVYDGPEDRNGRRNHDEIRFWADYVENQPYIVDDSGVAGGLDPWAAFVILGDLNADPDEGESRENPIRMLLSSPRVRQGFVPRADVAVAGLDADDTASFGLRVDYVLPSVELEVRAGGVWRHAPTGGDSFPSDHYPVWLDVAVPGS